MLKVFSENATDDVDRNLIIIYKRKYCNDDITEMYGKAS